MIFAALTTKHTLPTLTIVACKYPTILWLIPIIQLLLFPLGTTKNQILIDQFTLFSITIQHHQQAIIKKKKTYHLNYKLFSSQLMNPYVHLY